MRHSLKAWSLVFMILLAGCSAELKDYQASQPAFNLFGYFHGETRAWGMVQDYSDKQTRRFQVVIQGDVSGDMLTLIEDSYLMMAKRASEYGPLLVLVMGTIKASRMM